MSFDIWEEHLINIYLINLDSSGNSGSLGVISYYQKNTKNVFGFWNLLPEV
jgi:hypothetical protein